MTTIPDTLKATLEPSVLSAIVQALAPPPERRAAVAVDVEIEAVGEGTFTLSYKDRALSAKKGFARKPLVSLRLGKGTWPLLREQLQAAVDGFPQAPELKQRLLAAQTLTSAELDGVVAAIARIAEGTAISFDVAGAGVLVVARGPVDEITRDLHVGLDARQLRGLLLGAPPTAVTATLKGDRGVGTAVLAALGPVWTKLKGEAPASRSS